MSKIDQYAALQARIRALYAKMISNEKWDQLYTCRNNDEVVQILRDTVYQPYLENINENNLFPRRIEFEIKKHLTSIYETICRQASSEVRHLFKQLFSIYEVDNIKAILRAVRIGMTWERLRYLLFPYPESQFYRLQDLCEASSIEAVIDNLESSPYSSALSHALPRYTSEKTLFALEVALDLDYWRKLWKSINGLSGNDERYSKKIIGSSLDHQNLLWALRYRYFHSLSEEEIINYTLPFGNKIHDHDIQQIAAGGDVVQVLSRIYPYIPNLSELMHEPKLGLASLELVLQRDLKEKCENTFVGEPFHLGLPLAYLTLVEMEIQDLTVLLEANELGITRENYQQYLLYRREADYNKMVA